MKKNRLVYWFCATSGWLLIVLGLLATFFGIFASGESTLLMIMGGLLAIIVGILVVRIVEKNIFKALETFLDPINW